MKYRRIYLRYRPSVFIAQQRVSKAAFVAKSGTAAQYERPARYSAWASSTKLGAGCQPSLGNAPPPIRDFAAFSNFHLFQKNGYSKEWLFLRSASAGGCRSHTPSATSVSYAVFEPFSKGLAGGSSERSDYGFRPASCRFIEHQGSMRRGVKFRRSNSRSLPVGLCARAHSSVLSLGFPHMKFGAALPRIEATR